MKPRIFHAVILTILSITIASCNSGSESYEIRMQMKPGERFQQFTKMETKVDLGTLPGMEMKTATGAEFVVLEGDGSVERLKMTYLDLNTDFKFGVSGVDKRSDSMMKVNNKKLIGKSVVINVDDSRVVQVSGFEEVRDDINDTLPKIMFTPEAVNSLFGYMFAIYPGKPVKKGDSWRHQSTMSVMNMKMNMITTYTLVKVEADVAEIKASGTLAASADNAPGPAPVSVEGVHSAKYRIALNDGHIQGGDFSMELEGKMSGAMGTGTMKMRGKQVISDKPF
ncbi:MAG: hypothetical protein EOO01_19110 [Chitinophagaceae bacterium]|nr:MAG: hypothetical protein EOO01_19110 [Chitinophagaceae bacterium]